MYMSILPVCMYVFHVHAWYLWKSEEGIGSLYIGVIDGYGPLCECWEWILGPLQEQVLLTNEPPFQGNPNKYYHHFMFTK